MSNIADRILSKPRACKKPPPSACVARRIARDAEAAEEASVFHWVDFDIIEIGFPHEEDIQQFRQLCPRIFKTKELIRRRDDLLRRYLPRLRAARLIPRTATKFVEELFHFFYYKEGVMPFWRDYCNPKALTVERAKTQSDFIAKMHSERAEALSERDWSKYKNGP